VLDTAHELAANMGAKAEGEARLGRQSDDSVTRPGARPARGQATRKGRLGQRGEGRAGSKAARDCRIE
jgi:hypothetical protein